MNCHQITSVISVLIRLKISYVKIQIFRNRSFTWSLNYRFAKFLEILTNGYTVKENKGLYYPKTPQSVKQRLNENA